MWIYYYASFGPGHQSNDCGFKYFDESYDREDIKEHLFNIIDSNSYSIVLNFWEVDRPPAEYVESRIKSAKEELKSIKKRIKRLESISCFVPDQKEGKDPIVEKNMKGCITSDLLIRLHKAGLMYRAEDVNDWYWGKKHPVGSHREKALNIIRRTKKY
ncbi:hypothetical protein LCGC14_2552160 [marine sediment metagenome]|uniref:Uncharacterized protein n=1 Tax=marine sediment metagenome TaxID=412755 RepID=A0A0F9BAI2_9ZZZZ